MQTQTRVEVISLKKALEYLEHNKLFSYDNTERTNRPISMTSIQRYAFDMRRGQWKLTPQGIGFDINGDLTDGQQRLMALVMAATETVRGLEPDPNITFTTLVTRGLQPDVFDHIDVGRNRTTGQILAMSGVRNGTTLGAAGRIVSLFDNYPEITQWNRALITPHDIRELTQQENLGDYLYDANGVGRVGMIISSAVAAMHVCHRALPDGPHEKFIDQLKNGEYEDSPENLKGNPIFSLREYMIRNSQHKTIRTRQSFKHFFCYIKGWNDYVNGVRRFQMNWNRSQGVIRPIGWAENAR